MNDLTSTTNHNSIKTLKIDILNVELKRHPLSWLLLSFHKHALRVSKAPDQVCESSCFRPPRSLNSLACPASADSITTGAEMAAAGWVVPSLNSSLLLTPGLGCKKKSKKKTCQVSGKHSLTSHLKTCLLWDKTILQTHKKKKWRK